MDLPLVAAASSIDWSYWGHLAQGILALGLVIFIHEFGHFAAAKLCGVRVEKFYVGFDPYGLRLFRFRHGETEYGIGAIPLGGYVYMLGQTDNPGKQAEEAERAKALNAGSAAEGLVEGQTIEKQQVVWDPRSYPAQSVPERMLIISAGVIMNAITAFCFATVAYLMGVQYTPTSVTAVSPGGPAWEKNLSAGDVIVQIDDVTKPRFEADLRSRVALADLKKGLEFRVKRAGSDEYALVVHPRKPRADTVPSLGIAGPTLTKLSNPKDTKKFPSTLEGTPARAAVPAFEPGDEFVKIGDRDVHSYVDIATAMTEFADRKLPITVRRTTVDAGGTVTVREVKTEVAPRPLRMLGMTMQFGPIVSVQIDSPAAKAGLQVGDVLKSIDGEPLGDPVTASERFRRKQKSAPEKAWHIVVERKTGDSAKELTLDIVPRAADRFEAPLTFPYLSLPTLGIAYSIPPVIATVEPGSSAEKAGLKAGDTLTLFKTQPTSEPLESGEAPEARSIKLTENDINNWPACALGLTSMRNSTKIELTTSDGRKVVLEPIDSKEFFSTDRGFIFQAPKEIRKAEDLSQAFNYAWIDTRDSMTQVYRFLHAMWIGQIPPNNVGGVITIATQAGEAASGGLSTLLLFLMMLSCNLAVLNFLPFPVLDGGHMVLLMYEGIFRRPPPERFVNYLQLVGLCCLLFLMGYALKNDIFRLPWLN
ncbi:MAG: site-2 protease family protein [Planctomycetia bacterium]|nr:site-2 protease family protein [Planctomycetia bacterium]